MNKRSYTEEEANLVLSTLLAIILESKYDKAAQVSHLTCLCSSDHCICMIHASLHVLRCRKCKQDSVCHVFNCACIHACSHVSCQSNPRGTPGRGEGEPALSALH